MSNYSKALGASLGNRKNTPNSQPIPGREAEMHKSDGGGFVFTLNEWDQLDRFLILGVEGGTYYVGQEVQIKRNTNMLVALVKKDGIRVVDRVVEISQAGRAPKNDPALFALAIAASADDEATRQAALAALPKVARIGTHLFHFAEYANSLRGWGRALRRAVANWYLDMPVDKLANQVIKYQQRDGWSHRDMLRLGHPQSDDVARNEIFKWVTQKGTVNAELLHPQIQAFEQAKKATSAAEIVKLIQDANLPREAIPTEFLNDVKVWDALLQDMPMTAMIRNLGKMSSVGLLTPMSEASKLIKNKLADSDVLRKARVHPIQILSALFTYRMGRGVKGSNTWNPVTNIVDALDNAFYGTFGNVTPTGKNTLLALDVSGSMTSGAIGGVTGLNPRVASAAMALITANVEDNYEFIGFTGGSSGWGGSHKPGFTTKDGDVSVLNISPKMTIGDVATKLNGLPFGGTDCALAYQWALRNKVPVESFAVYTDNETNVGWQSPGQALRDYRQKMGIPAKSCLVGMTATNATVADPQDSGMIDVVGFDSSTPQIMSDFFSK